MLWTAPPLARECQVHGIDAAGQVVIRRQLKRRFVLSFFEKLPPCLVGIDACASSHHWSRELHALGHTVRLMPPAYVKLPRGLFPREQNQTCGGAYKGPTKWQPVGMRPHPTQTPGDQDDDQDPKRNSR
jgi:hypothetical protein